MKASVLFLDSFQQSYDIICNHKMTVSEARKVVIIDQEISDVKTKIDSFKNERVAWFREQVSKNNIAEESTRYKEYLEKINQEINDFANEIDFIPSVKLGAEVSEGIMISPMAYALVADFFE